jgi:hypothetical protein
MPFQGSYWGDKLACMTLKRFLQLASKRERAEVAVVCNDSVSYLYQLAGQHRYASALLATRIEAATREVAECSGGVLGTVPRESLVRHPEIFSGLDHQRLVDRSDACERA